MSIEHIMRVSTEYYVWVSTEYKNRINTGYCIRVSTKYRTIGERGVLMLNGRRIPDRAAKATARPRRENRQIRSSENLANNGFTRIP